MDTVVPDDLRLVDAWARAAGHPSWRRVPALLAALAGRPAEEADALPLGAVAAAVLQLVRAWSPAGLEATVPCRECGEHLSATVAVDGLLALANPAAGAVVTVRAGGIEVTVRAPRPDDMAAAAAAGDAGAAARVLLERCLVSPEPDGVVADPVVTAAVARAWEELDPLGVVALAVTCPACGTQDAPLADLIGWGWALVDARVHRLFGEVHRLASAYGWSEADVLALGPWRRRAYLDLVP